MMHAVLKRCTGYLFISVPRYAGMADKTEETLGAGVLKSGDLGRLDEAGRLFITGRSKELIITAGGENIPPILIEDQVKSCYGVISNCMLVGEDANFSPCS